MNVDTILNHVIVAEKHEDLVKIVHKAFVEGHILVDHAKDFEALKAKLKSEGERCVVLAENFSEQSFISLIQKIRLIEDKNQGLPFVYVHNKPVSAQEKILMQELGHADCSRYPVRHTALKKSINALVTEKQQFDQIKILQKYILDKLNDKNDLDALKKPIEALKAIGKKGALALAEIYENLDKIDEAIQIVNRLQSRDQDNISYINILGRLFFKKNDMEVAKRWYERADLLAPSNISRLHALGDIYLRSEKADRAQDVFAQLVNMHPENPQLACELAEKLVDADMQSHAKTFIHSHSNAMEMTRYYNNKGVLASRDKQYTQAINEYVNALKFVENDQMKAKVLYNFALAYIGLGGKVNLANAKKNFILACKLDPEYDKAREKLKKFT